MHYKRIAFAATLLFGSAGWAMVQGTAPSPAASSPQGSTTGAPYAGTSANPDGNATRAGNAGLERGANSFTEGQARRRIEDRGYTNVGGLRKDQNSIWQAEATKDGHRVRVGLDFRGNVVEENR
jgi:periplasmic protein CpxP/Spy